MTRHRFYAPPPFIDPEERRVRLPAEETHHLKSALRLAPGDEVFVFDGAGREFHCRIEDVARDGAALAVLGEVAPARPESPLRLTLCQALLKGEKFDLVVQKATELGAHNIIPVTSQHEDVRLNDASDGARRAVRWRRIALEAAKQSGRARVPDILAPVDFESLIRTPPPVAGARLFFSERRGCRLSAAMKGAPPPVEIAALVGPEGGWSNIEIQAAVDNDWAVVTLGGRILRAETAAIAVTTILEHRFGDVN